MFRTALHKLYVIRSCTRTAGGARCRPAAWVRPHRRSWCVRCPAELNDVFRAGERFVCTPTLVFFCQRLITLYFPHVFSTMMWTETKAPGTVFYQWRKKGKNLRTRMNPLLSKFTFSGNDFSLGFRDIPRFHGQRLAFTEAGASEANVPGQVITLLHTILLLNASHFVHQTQERIFWRGMDEAEVAW